MSRFVCIAIVLSLSCVFLPADGQALDLEELQAELEASGASWTAGETSMSRLTPEELAAHFNLVIEIPEGASPPPGGAAADDKDLPAYLDWRDVNGMDFTTPIKDQHPCGTCATFSSVGAFEALIKITLNNPFIQPDLSEQHVYSCAGAFPYTFFHPLGQMQREGASDDACMPYQCEHQGDRPPCEAKCADWANRVFRISDHRMYMFPRPQVIMEILQYGPVVAGFQAMEDFQYYTGGVYEHTTGGLLGGHGVVIVGYDEAGQYWICKNSWGTNWGEEGWFRIRWGTGLLGFGYQTFSVTVDVNLLCGINVPPAVDTLVLPGADVPLGEFDDLEIAFNYFDFEANLAGGELWYSVDGAEPLRYSEPLTGLVDTSSAALDALPTYILPGPFGPGEHNLTVFVRDLCGGQSNDLSAVFSVEGEIPGDDDEAGDDAGGDDDDDSGGCGGY